MLCSLASVLEKNDFILSLQFATQRSSDSSRRNFVTMAEGHV